jgi:F420-non-reducing hydrogenase small subunit
MATTDFAVLNLSGCSGCEVGLLNAEAWTDTHRLAYMPLVLSSEDLPEVGQLIVSGAVYTDEDLYRLRLAATRAEQVIAVGTCAISGGVANLGYRDEVRERFFQESGRRHLPRMLPRLLPVDAVVPVDLYLPGCPPMPWLFTAALFQPTEYQTAKSVCLDCGREKTRQRPARLSGFQRGNTDPQACLINQGYLCIGSSTRGGCRAPCTRAGNPCVGCRGPSDGFISRSAEEWFEAMARVFARMTDIPADEIDEALRSPQLSLFVFQFADYGDRPVPVVPRNVEKVL